MFGEKFIPKSLRSVHDWRLASAERYIWRCHLLHWSLRHHLHRGGRRTGARDGSAGQTSSTRHGRGKCALVPVRFALLAIGVRALGSVWAGASELEHVPVEDIVVSEPLFMEQVSEELPKVAVKEQRFKIKLGNWKDDAQLLRTRKIRNSISFLRSTPSVLIVNTENGW